MKKRQLISFDWALKHLLRSKANFEILEGFLSELLRDKVCILEILESESNKESSNDKYNRVDLKVKNDRGEVILIELQYERELDYLQRLLYGTAKVITEHMVAGEAYANVVKIIAISILYFDLGRGTDYIYRGTTTFEGMHTHDKLELSDGQKALFQRSSVASIFPEYYLIKVGSFDDVAHDTLDEWVYFLKNGEIHEDFTARGLGKARERLNILQLPEAERKSYEQYQDDLRDQASMVQSTYGIGKWEGKQEGLQEGLQKGLQEGLQKGLQEGLQKGEQVGEAKILLRLLAKRMGDLPSWVPEKVNVSDLETLGIWSDRVLDARTLEDVFGPNHVL